MKTKTKQSIFLVVRRQQDQYLSSLQHRRVESDIIQTPPFETTGTLDARGWEFVKSTLPNRSVFPCLAELFAEFLKHSSG